MRAFVFAGAGASRAVGDYPTTAEFFGALPSDIQQTTLFIRLLEYFAQNSPEDQLDIERVLWTLLEIRRFAASVGSHTHPLGWLLAGNRVNDVTRSQVDHTTTLGTIQALERKCQELESQINRQVYKYYAPLPDPEALKGTWVALLQGLLVECSQLELFTTNYDLVIESALEQGNFPISDGRTKGIRPILKEDLWQEASSGSPSPVRGRLTKLHGSVDWSVGDKVIHTGTPTWRGTHEEHVILYPGFKGAPTKSPFTLFHQHLSRTAATAELAIFIGFAFRDEYINGLFQSRLPENCRILILNPAEHLPGLPLVPVHVEHLVLPFDKDSIDVLLAAVKARAT